ncbi:MAG: lipid-A-disaccharide synthase N-terminal domain-containing protein [Rhizomicrobium sp.]
MGCHRIFGCGGVRRAIFIQWLKSEMEGRSVIPIAFWYCSLAGALINLVYVIHLKSVPLVLGNALPLFIYARNLYLTYRERAALAHAASV